MRIVTGFMPQTSGEALVRGFDVEEQSFEAKRLVGHLPENAPCSSDMTASGFLKFCGEARGLRGAGLKDGVDRAITTCFLEPFVHPSINPLSKGYRHQTGSGASPSGSRTNIEPYRLRFVRGHVGTRLLQGHR
ncbi:MAG: hypothetical protein WCI38_06550 [Chthoniobacterales bacterium]